MVTPQQKTVDSDVDAIERLVLRMRGRKLPPERDLAKQFNISRARVRTVLDDLESRGLVARQQGSGTYALEQGTTAVSNVVLLVDARLKLGADPFFSAVVERVQQVCQMEKIRCTLERLAPGEKPVILEDGIIGVGSAARDVLERLTRRDVPAVGLFTRATITPGSRVTILDLDHGAGGRIAVRRLLDAGCCQLLFVGCDSARSCDLQVAAAEQVATEAGCKISKIESEIDFAAGLSVAAQISMPQDPSSRIGIIAANGWLALGLHTGLVMRGARVRERVEIVGFEGIPQTDDGSLRIRSLVPPVDAMAADAVAELRRLATSPLSCGREILYPFAEQQAEIQRLRLTRPGGSGASVKIQR